jgi:ABC-type polysaccharide/polyol phosphate export permease
MANTARQQVPLRLEAFAFIELIYFNIVREVRAASGNAALGLLAAIGKLMAMVLIFWAMFAVIGMRSSPIRGDMLLFLIGGIQIFLMHNAAIGAVIQAGNSTSPMLMHAPMTTSLTIISGALSALYLNMFAAIIILTAIYLFRGGLDIYQWQYALIPWILGWASGVGVGLIFLIAKPFAPRLMAIVSLLYRRANLITSGKFLVANMLPATFLPYFTWNPLFHAIDQTRGFVFVNYVAHKTSMNYLIWFTIISIVIGMMGEFWVRKKISRSKSATQ